jgi:hypothetical protein
MSHKNNSAHSDLLSIKHILYDQCDFSILQLHIESEGSEYGACAFIINDSNIKFRVAKITTKKIGQFVTLWKRASDGQTRPHDANDDVSFFVISTRAKNHFGQFIFPKSVLIEKDIFSVNGNGGKRGIRVYPPWDRAENSQAIKTQKWQLQYFLDLTNEYSVDYEFARSLYSTE